MKLLKFTKVFFIVLSIVVILAVSSYFAMKTTSRPKTIETMSNMEKNIDVIYYINLDHRTDRNEEFLKQMEILDFPEEKLIRIPAIYKKGQGSLGCTMSHIKTMETFINSGHNTCIIFEDDFDFSVDKEQIEKSITQLFENDPDFDVCMLASLDYQVEPIEGVDYIKKVYAGVTTSGFIVNRKFAPVLLENFKEGCEILERKFKDGNGTYQTEHTYEIDEYWKKLQPGSNFFVFNPKLGKQRETYSDILEHEIKGSHF